MKLPLFILSVFLLLSGCSSKPADSAAVASAHPVATRAGIEIMRQGCNAFDAAVTVSATLAVVEPYSSGMGGGGFWLLHNIDNDKFVMVDGRETAPGKAHRKMYQDDNGKVIEKLSRTGALAAGIPGQAAALVHIAKKYGKCDLATTLKPAIDAANNGFKVTPHYQRMAKWRLNALQASPAAAKVFLQNNDVPEKGYVIKQPDLANTLHLLAEKGNAGFYHGDVAKKMVVGVQQANGIWTMADLARYEIKERKPVEGEYKGYRIISAAPPSSGGVAIMSMLKMLEQDDLIQTAVSERTHLVVEAMRRAYRDRAEFLGDPDFINVPVSRLISDEHNKKLRDSFNLNQATPSSTLKQVGQLQQGNHTTHFSVIDKQGNKVSATLSINYPFGSGFMPEGTGVLLNDEMDDFSSKPGVPNAYGLVGAEANAIEPNKRMLSSMTPTFVIGKDKTAIIGSPGGSRIITMVLHGVLGFVEGKSAKQIVKQPRYHHQFLPDVIQHEEDTFDELDMHRLNNMGHKFKKINYRYGNMQLIIQDHKNNSMTAASDPRGEGESIVD